MSAAEERKFLVDELPEKRRKFVLAYVGESAGNASSAARIAGYAAPGEEGYRLLKNARILEAIEELQLATGSDSASMVAGLLELRAFWSRVVRGEESDIRIVRDKEGEQYLEDVVPIIQRLKASELLGKSQAAFVERHEVTGAQGAPIAVTIDIASAKKIARGEQDG